MAPRVTQSELPNPLGKLLRQRRFAMNLRLEDVALKMAGGEGATTSFLSAVECGHKALPAVHLSGLSEALEIPLADLQAAYIEDRVNRARKRAQDEVGQLNGSGLKAAE